MLMTRMALAAAFLGASALGAELPKGKTFTNSIGMKLVRIEPGSFLMGCGEKPPANAKAPIVPAAFLTLQPDHPDADPDGLVPLPNLSLEQEVVEQMQALRLFQANLATIKTQDRMLGALLDMVS